MAGRNDKRPYDAEGRESTAPDLQLGTAGASARARYDALRRRDDARRRTTFGRLAPLARLLGGPNEATEAWRRGAEGEERIGAYLRRAVGEAGIVLHDRAIRGSRANLDHLVVVSSGVWVIDSKHYRGRLERKRVGRWYRSRSALSVAGRDATALVAGARRQRETVAEVVGPAVPVRAALCFTGTEWALFARPFIIDDVLVAWPKALVRAMGASGPLHGPERAALARRIAQVLPPYPGSRTTGSGRRAHRAHPYDRRP
jgi:hypothetical protein